MKRTNFNRKLQRQLRHKRITKKLHACENTRPRLVVSKTTHHIYAQLIDDNNNKVLASASTLTLKLKNNNIANAAKVGEAIAKKAAELKIKQVAFDRGGNKYHGRIEALANAARKGGMDF